MSSTPVAVCVGHTPEMQKLIVKAAEYARELGAPLQAVHIACSSSSEDENAIAKNLNFARILGAEIIERAHNDLSQGIISFLRDEPVSALFIGRSKTHRWRRWTLSDTATQVLLHTDQVDVRVIEAESFTHTEQRFNLVVEYIICFATVMLATVGLHTVQRFVAEADIMMTYLAVVVILAYAFNRGPTVLAAITSVAAFDFFFVSPFYTFAVDHEKYFISFAVMAIVSFMFSSFSERAKQQLRETSTREKQLSDLYFLACSLAATSSDSEVIKLVCLHIGAVSNSEAAAFRWVNDIAEPVVTESPITPREISPSKLKVCMATQKCVTEQDSAGRELHYHVLSATGGLILVLRFNEIHNVEHGHLLQTYLSLANLAITRTQMSDKAAKALIQAESEQLRNAVLSAVSHDLRTPLGTIMGLSSTLLDKEVQLDEFLRLECLHSIYNLSEQLSQKVTNLLQMSRNLRGKLIAELELQNPEEFIGGILTKMEHCLQNHHLAIDLDETLLIPMDISLMEVVLSNLLENAVKFSSEHSKIKVSGRRVDRYYRLSVEDQGQGLRDTDNQKLFEEFYRINQNIAGTGLGLAICKAIVDVHGGSISAQNAPVQGSIFSVDIPLHDEQLAVGIYE